MTSNRFLQIERSQVLELYDVPIVSLTSDGACHNRQFYSPSHRKEMPLHTKHLEMERNYSLFVMYSISKKLQETALATPLLIPAR